MQVINIMVYRNIITMSLFNSAHALSLAIWSISLRISLHFQVPSLGLSELGLLVEHLLTLIHNQVAVCATSISEESYKKAGPRGCNSIFPLHLYLTVSLVPAGS